MNVKLVILAGFALVFITLAILLPESGTKPEFNYVETPQGSLPCVIFPGRNGVSCDWTAIHPTH